jgi:hypothetical protein
MPPRDGLAPPPDIVPDTSMILPSSVTTRHRFAPYAILVRQKRKTRKKRRKKLTKTNKNIKEIRKMTMKLSAYFVALSSVSVTSVSVSAK